MKRFILTAAIIATALTPLSANAASKVSVPKLSSKVTATLHLGIIRDHFEQYGSKKSFFSSSSEINNTLLQDLDLFLSKYSGLAITAEALFLKGKMQLQQGNEEAAAIAWLQVLYEYPKSDTAIGAKQRLLVLIEKGWRKHADKIKLIADKSIKGKKGSRLADLIRQLYKIETKSLIKPLANLQLEFLKRFPNHSDADEVQVLFAHNMSVISAKSGLFAFKKLLALYPNSSYRPESLLACGDLQRKKLKGYDSAKKHYQELIKDYPRHRLVKNAYANLGLTYEKHMKKYPEAIVAYNHVVKRFPKDKEALNALQHIAKLQEKKTEQPREAVATLRKLATTFHGDEGIDALKAAIKITDNKLNDLPLIVTIQEQLIRDYPNSKEAPKMMFKTAEKAEKAGDSKRAKSLYQQFLKKYPDHKLAKKANKRL